MTYLLPNITIMIKNRVHSIAGVEEIPNFEDYEKKQSESSDPIATFCQWKEVVELLINDKKSSKEE